MTRGNRYKKLLLACISIYCIFMVLNFSQVTLSVKEVKEPTHVSLAVENPKVENVGPTSCECEPDYLPLQYLYQRVIDQRIKWLNLTTVEYLRNHHPNFPTSILPSALQGKCHLLPPPHRVPWSNRYWQKAVVEDTTFRLYSAFLDNRLKTGKRPHVLILGSTMTLAPKVPWCYLWFNASGPPVVSLVKLKYPMKTAPSAEFANPYILICPFPQEEAYRKPLAVSLVEKPCMIAKNLMEVVGSMERNNATAYREGKPPPDDDGTSGFSVAACGTAVYYYTEDYSIRLVEWLEILRAIGFSRVFLHETDVHPNISKVFRHYEQDGFLGTTKYTYPEPFFNEASIRWLWHEQEQNAKTSTNPLIFSDCILRRMHEYRFIAHIDLDEIPMFIKYDSYPAWLDDTLKKVTAEYAILKMHMPASYKMNWRYHFADLPPSAAGKDLPSYLFNTRHSKVRNVEPLMKPGVKSLYDMDSVTTVSGHHILSCNSGKCQPAYKIPLTEGYMGHFKADCGEYCLEPGRVNEVNFILNYKNEIEAKVTKVLKKLQLI